MFPFVAHFRKLQLVYEIVFLFRKADFARQDVGLNQHAHLWHARGMVVKMLEGGELNAKSLPAHPDLLKPGSLSRFFITSKPEFLRKCSIWI